MREQSVGVYKTKALVKMPSKLSLTLYAVLVMNLFSIFFLCGDVKGTPNEPPALILWYF